MNGETGFLHSFAVGSVPVCGGSEGSSPLRARFATDLYSVGSFDPYHDAIMRIGQRSSGRRAHSLWSASVPCSNTASRHLGSSIRQSAEKPAHAPNGAEWYARSGKPFQDVGRKTTPSNGSPVVTKRHNAMISLRARATIMVLRV